MLEILRSDVLSVVLELQEKSATIRCVEKYCELVEVNVEASLVDLYRDVTKKSTLITKYLSSRDLRKSIQSWT